MNEGPRDLHDGRVAALLREAAQRMSPRGDPARLVERALANSTDRLLVVNSPLGRLYVGAGPRGVRLVRLGGSAEGFARDYRRRFGRLLSEGKDRRTLMLAERLARALSTDKVEVPVDLSGTTPFQRRVLEVVGGIPRGEVRPYAWVAREAGSPGASRAVGTALANNPVPLVVPCHRVVRNDGTTGGYAFGAPRKVELLRSEGVPVEELERALYVATPTTGIVCHATCRNARRIRPENRRPYRSVGGAIKAGYRPCRVCRPVVSGGVRGDD